MIKKMEKTCCLYCRVSSEGDRQSTTRQVEDLNKFCLANDYAIKGIYEEHVSGAKKNEQRKVLMDCLNYCCTNHISVLAIHELSRLGRSTLQVLRSLEMLHEAKVSVYIHNLGLYTLMEDGSVNPIASIICTVMSELGSIERSQIAYRLQSGRALYKVNGGKFGNEGYRKTKEKKAEEYKDVISYLKKGYSIRITAKITGRGISTVQRLKHEFEL
jgi:DNA invertase Pin-like site-specific DNA recombinase